MADFNSIDSPEPVGQPKARTNFGGLAGARKMMAAFAIGQILPAASPELPAASSAKHRWQEGLPGTAAYRMP